MYLIEFDHIHFPLPSLVPSLSCYSPRFSQLIFLPPFMYFLMTQWVSLGCLQESRREVIHRHLTSAYTSDIDVFPSPSNHYKYVKSSERGETSWDLPSSMTWCCGPDLMKILWGHRCDFKSASGYAMLAFPSVLSILSLFLPSFSPLIFDIHWALDDIGVK